MESFAARDFTKKYIIRPSPKISYPSAPTSLKPSNTYWTHTTCIYVQAIPQFFYMRVRLHQSLGLGRYGLKGQHLELWLQKPLKRPGEITDVYGLQSTWTDSD